MLEARRFAIVCPNLHPRVCGVGDYSIRLADELSRRGHDVALFSRAPAEPHPAAPHLRVVGVAGRSPLAIARRLDDQLQQHRPSDLILQYTPQMWDSSRFGSPAVPWLAARSRRRGVRSTLIVHEPYVPWLARPDLAAAAVVQRGQLMALVRSVDRLFLTTNTRARAVAPLSRLAGGPVPQVLRVGAGAVPVGPSAGARKEGLRLGYFSTAGVGKRFDVALEAFRTIAERHPSAELVLIGDLGPADSPRVAAVHEWVREHPARARIRLTGNLSLDEIAREVAELDMYLFPMETGANSRSSTLPLALGAGLPVVATRGLETDPELFRDGQNIAFAPALTGAAFASVALRLIEDRGLRDTIGAGARQLYDAEMSWPRIADVFLQD